MDEMNIEIIRHLADGRKTFKKIAKSLGVAENTIRARVTKLINRGILRVAAIVDPSEMPGHFSAYIGINTSPNQASEIAEKIGKLKGVISSVCVSGTYDIMLLILLNEEYNMDKFMFEELSKVEGITRVDQFSIFKGFNHRCRYVL